MLVKRLQNHVLGKIDMSATQLKACEVLLKKSLPDLSAVDNTIKGDVNAPLAITTLDALL